MKTTIEVADSDEAERIKIALSDPEVRAFVNVAGVLLKLPSSKRSQARVLQYAWDYLEEKEGKAEG